MGNQMKYTIKKLIRTGLACPSQWGGVLDGGAGIWIRYRYGLLSVRLYDKSTPFSLRTSEYVYGKQIGDSMDGALGDAGLIEWLDHLLDFPAAWTEGAAERDRKR